MYRLILGTVFGLLLFSNVAMAACTTFHTLTNGTTADATQVMDNFNYILNCPNFTGPVGIGTSSPSASLDVYGAIHGNGDGLSYSATNAYGGGLDLTANNGDAWYLRIDNGSLSGDPGAFVIYNGTSGHTGQAMHFSPTGSVVSVLTASFAVSSIANCNPVKADSSGTLNCSSDERLKDVKEFYRGGLKALDHIQPIIYSWKPGSGLKADRPVIGFSAQNVERAIPEAITLDPKGYRQLNQEVVLAAAVNAIKELKAANDNDHAKVASLQLQLSSLERRVNTRTAQK